MVTRRTLLSALAVLPLVGCASPAPAAPAGSPGASGAAPAPSASGTPVVVFAPGALAAHTKALAAAFAAAGLGTVSFEVGHTPVQREQLAQGATPDVWIAASPADMKTAADKGLVRADAVAQLATTRLIVVTAPENPGQVSALADLAKPGVKVLLAVETLPIWTTTKKTFDKVEATRPGFTAAVLANTVSREMGVSAIVQKVQLGEADAGVVFVTDVPAGSPVGTVAVPDDVNTTLALSLAPVTAGKNPAGAAVFARFMTVGEGRDVLTRAGYLPPQA